MSDKPRIWRNWAQNQLCRPTRIHSPQTEDDLVKIVRAAATAGEHVKVVGAGHSFTAIAITDGRLVKLDGYNEITNVNLPKKQVTVQAGISLAELNEQLDALALAMPNLGDIAYQSVAGATSTATHGTGWKFGGLATQIAGMRLIAGDGSIVDCSAEREPDVFRAARVGLGALGIVSTVTLQCVEAFNLRAVEMPMRVDEVLEELERHNAENDHFEFFWIPNTGWALTKRNQRTQDPLETRGRWKEFRDDILITNFAFGAMCRVGRVWPGLIPRVAKAIPTTGRTDYVDKSYRVFASPRLIKFYEMEYAIPAENLIEALNRVRDFVHKSGMQLSFPVEVRFVAPDDIPLSTASGRQTAYVAIHVFQHTPYQQYFEAVEDIMDDYGGRPHWGKLHFQTAETLAPRYPEWDAFQAVRRRMDPEGVFTNPYLQRVLG